MPKSVRGYGREPAGASTWTMWTRCSTMRCRRRTSITSTASAGRDGPRRSAYAAQLTPQPHKGWTTSRGTRGRTIVPRAGRRRQRDCRRKMRKAHSAYPAERQQVALLGRAGWASSQQVVQYTYNRKIPKRSEDNERIFKEYPLPRGPRCVSGTVPPGMRSRPSATTASSTAAPAWPPRQLCRKQAAE